MGHLGIIATGEENTYKQNTNGYFKTSSFRYDEDEAKSNRDNQEKSRAALQRYLFLFEWRQSVSPFHFVFSAFMGGFCIPALHKWLVTLFHHCPCQPARDLVNRVSGLVFVFVVNKNF